MSSGHWTKQESLSLDQGMIPPFLNKEMYGYKTSKAAGHISGKSPKFILNICPIFRHCLHTPFISMIFMRISFLLRLIIFLLISITTAPLGFGHCAMTELLSFIHLNLAPYRRLRQ